MMERLKTLAAWLAGIVLANLFVFIGLSPWVLR